MCMVSAIMDYGRSISSDYWNPQTWPSFEEILEKARRWDELNKQPNCEDPEKATWIKDIERRLTELEKKV